MNDVDCTCSPPPEFLVPPPPKPPLMLTECDELQEQFHTEDNCEYYEPVLESYFLVPWTPLVSLTVSVVTFLLFGLCILLVCKRRRKFMSVPVERNSVFADVEIKTSNVNNEVVQEKNTKLESGDPKPHILAVAPEPPLFICYASEELFHPEYQVLPFNPSYNVEGSCFHGTSISEDEYLPRPNVISAIKSNDVCFLLRSPGSWEDDSHHTWPAVRHQEWRTGSHLHPLRPYLLPAEALSPKQSPRQAAGSGANIAGQSLKAEIF